ncbi:toll/interleukin-1 receptor domain-containing protein [Pseudophaeobacter sp. 1A16562]|uniref:toll/interleukin-1 receptor domain-containing protein n=1 Tax=Pseudophaeobacter sp. 1A16562 TaxID=3098143 RepID=UPI0034D50F7C
MIFISHTYGDKPVVEPVAMRLREIFGEDKVFYDAWSIRPGDGIIEKMNKGLTDPRFVFFFVSEASLKSKMVELEWQNALMKATKGECKIIPVRVDDTPMPALLTQTLYIDMFSNGIDIATQQIIGVVQGTKGFEPAHEKFSNLTWSTEGTTTKELVISIGASHLMEPNPYFLVLLDNDNKQVNVKLTNGSPSVGGYNPGVVVSGVKVNAWAIAPMGGAITPKHPLQLTVTSKDGSAIVLRGIMHKSSGEEYTTIPPSKVF